MKHMAVIGLKRLDDETLKFEMRKSVAKKLFWKVRRLIPRDEDRKRSADIRKIYGSQPSWHLQDRGAAFVGSKRVASRGYRADDFNGRKDEITFVFSNPKETGERATKSEGGLFDYAEYVTTSASERGDAFEAELATFENSGVIEDAVSEAFDEYWDKL